MDRANGQDSPACRAGCPNCGPGGMAPTPGAPAGGTMALMSAIFFLGPLVTAIVGAALLPVAWSHQASQLLGGLGGLALGVWASLAVVNRLHRAGRKNTDESHDD